MICFSLLLPKYFDSQVLLYIFQQRRLWVEMWSSLSNEILAQALKTMLVPKFHKTLKGIYMWEGAHVELKTNHSSYTCFFPSCLLSCPLNAVPSSLPVSKEVHLVSPFSPLKDSFTHCKATSFPLALFRFFQGSVTQTLILLHAFLGIPAWVPCWANYSALPKETSAWIWKDRQIILSPLFTLIRQFFFVQILLLKPPFVMANTLHDINFKNPEWSSH